MTVLMLSLAAGGFGAAAESSKAGVEVYKGIWMPALVKEALYGQRFHSMSDVETLKEDGVNTIGFVVPVTVNRDGSIDVESFHIYLEVAKKIILRYHEAGFKIFLTIEVSYGGEGEPVPVPKSIVETPGFIEEYDSLVLEVAQVAEEYGVELFAPTLEPDYYLGGVDFAAKWCKKILPKVREEYKGKLMVRLAFQEIALQDLDFNIEGYDVLGICIYPFEDCKVSRDRVKLFIDKALKLASKYGVPQVTTEFGVWGRALRSSLSEEVLAEAHRVVFEEGEGKLAGFFVFDPPFPRYWRLKGSLAELVIREWYTEKLPEAEGETLPGGEAESSVEGGEPEEKAFKPKFKFKPVDLTGNGKVDLEDLKELKKVYGLTVERPDFRPEADFNDDGKIDIVDLAILASQYGK